MTRIPITLGSLVIDGRRSSGVEIGCSTLSGWYDGPGVRTNFEEHVSQHGAADSPSLRTPRVVTLTGWVYAPTRAAAADAIQRVVGELGDGNGAVLTVADPDYGTMSAWVRLSAEPQVTWNPSGLAKWQLTVTAPDPRLYGPERVRSSQLADALLGQGLQYPLTYPLDYGDVDEAAGKLWLPNDGTTAYWPRLRIERATVPRVWLVETGASLRFNVTHGPGQWLDVICKDRRVLANGVASRRFATTYSGDWLAVPPGGATLAWETDVYDPDSRLWVWHPEGAWL